jgi:HAE1 family hydrophobic/amphiphilic exporter-1
MSQLARLSLAHRSLVALLSVAIIVFGLISTRSLKQELLPSLEMPGAFITTVYPGASPEIVEREVTEPIETAIAGTDGLEQVTSTSSNGFSMVQAEFEYGTDISEAVQEIQESVNRLRGQLPSDVDPTVQAGNFNDFPVLLLEISSSLDQRELARRLQDLVVPELEKISDVRDVEVTGLREDRVEVRLDDAALARSGVTPQDVVTALQANGVSVPGGELTTGDRSVTVEVGAPFASLRDLEQVTIVPRAAAAGALGGQGSGAGGASGRGDSSNRGEPGDSAGQGESGQSAGQGEGAGQRGPGTATGSGTASAPGASGPGRGTGRAAPGSAPVRLSDVADVTTAPAEATSITRTNGKPSLGLSVMKTTDGNTVAVSHDVRDALDRLSSSLGDDVEVVVVFDQAPFIEKSIEGLTTEGTIGLVFAVLVILVFLLSLRSTLVTAVSIPFSLLVAMIGLYAGGYSLNILTLGALTVAIGRVVDDSIVVLENIKRHLGYGEAKQKAILNGVREVAGAVSASTFTTVGVFLPIAFVGGQVGELFRPFGVTVTIALLASLLVSLTIIPVLAYWFLRPPRVLPGEEQRFRAEAEAKERRNLLQRGYVPVIRWTTRHRVVTVLAGILVFAGTIAATPLLKTNFLDDPGNNTMTVTQVMPVSSSLARTDEAARKVERVLADVDGIETYQTTVGAAEFAGFTTGGGANQATFWLTLEEDVDKEVVATRLRDRLARIEDAGTLTVQEVASGFGGSNLEVIVTAPTSQSLRVAAERVERAVAKVPGATDVTNTLGADLPTIHVDVDRAKAAALGLSDAQVGQAVRQAFAGQRVASVVVDSEQRDVLLYTSERPTSLDRLRALPIGTPVGTTVRLDEVADVSEVTRPAELTRIDGERSATISAAATAEDLGRVTTDLQAALEELDLPRGATYRIAGVSSEQREAFGQLGVALLAAIAIVYLIMVATFRSIAQPLILLVSIPFAATGALALLLGTNTALGVPALIGLLMLVGIVVTNAIVLIDLINQYREQGMSLQEAVVEGGRRRLRPILMTALATICALIPMSLGITGGGVFVSKPLALVVIGGLVSSTLLTLILVPTLYTMLENAKERRRARRQRRRTERAEQRRERAEPVPSASS